VVTSITRPTSEQPRNASPYSVHPTGMALDLRIPAKGSCRKYLESRLLRLERDNVLDATRENRPPHYHIALNPTAYRNLVAGGKGKGSPSNGDRTWQVSSGDTLWDIARRVGVSVTAIKSANGMKSSMIKPGQVLRLP
ncbi:MAG: LysM peptidoglycan-binding domain-containing protein, partial [Thermoanaerobaculia bacterium]